MELDQEASVALKELLINVDLEEETTIWTILLKMKSEAKEDSLTMERTIEKEVGLKRKPTKDRGLNSDLKNNFNRLISLTELLLVRSSLKL